MADSKHTGTVQYYMHVHRNFIRAYGTAFEELSDENISKKIKAFNFEMLNRPEVQLSESCETFTKGLEAIQGRMDVLHKNQDVLNKFYRRLQQISNVLQPYSTFDGNSNIEGQKKEHFDTLIACFMQMEKNSFHRVASVIYQLGASMAMVAIHYFLLSYSLRNPKELAEKVYSTGQTKRFKQTKHINCLRDLISARCGHIGPSSAAKLDDICVLSGNETAASQDTKKIKMTTPEVEVPVLDDSIEPGNIDLIPDVETPGCKSKRKRRNNKKKDLDSETEDM